MKVFGPQGNGELLLLVHGALSDGLMWYPHMQLASEHFKVLSYTQRYFGENPQAPSSNKPFGIQTHAEDLIALTESLNRPKVHVVSWSYGADVSLAAAALAPELFASVYAYEPGSPIYLAPHQEALYWQDTEQWFTPIKHFVDKGDWVSAAKTLVNCSAQETGYFDTQPQSIQASQLRNLSSLAWQLSASPWNPPQDLFESLIDISPKIHIAYGEETRQMFQIASQAAADKVPNAQLRIIPNSTHMLPLEDPDTFIQIMANTLFPKNKTVPSFNDSLVPAY